MYIYTSAKRRLPKVLTIAFDTGASEFAVELATYMVKKFLGSMRILVSRKILCVYSIFTRIVMSTKVAPINETPLNGSAEHGTQVPTSQIPFTSHSMFDPTSWKG